MSYCAFCGTQVASGAAACPQCGNPPGGVRQPRVTVKGPTNALPILIILIGGGVLFIAFLGIVAALIIPNFLDALQKAKQKRSLADLRELGTALVSYSVDHQGTFPPGENLAEVRPALAPKYLEAVPNKDAWERPFRYGCWQERSSSPGCDHFRLASAGRDGVFESADLKEYDAETFSPTDYDRDLVLGDGLFLQYPLRPGQQQR